MSIIFVFKSVTYAQKAQKLLSGQGIVSSISKAPAVISMNGCAHCLKISDKNFSATAEIIKGIPRTGVFSRDRNGRYERVSL